MKLTSFFSLLLVSLILTFSACKKDVVPEYIPDLREISLTSSQEYPLGVVNEWTSLNNAISYDVYKKGSDDEEYNMIISLDGSATTYFDTTTVEDIEYQYYVEGISSDLEGVVTSNITTGKSVQLTTENSFGLLADLTGGVYTQYGSADSLTDIIVMLLDSFATDTADIMFLIDKTSSMWDDIAAVQGGLGTIISLMPPQCRLGFAAYGDFVADSVWTGGDWYDFEDLTLNHALIQTLVDNIVPTGGLGWEESVFDGLHRTISKADWQADNKLLLVIGDAPPLTIPCTTGFPVECTNNSIMDVVTACFANSVVTNIYPVVNTNWKKGGSN